jgi:hypothetical protein
LEFIFRWALQLIADMVGAENIAVQTELIARVFGGDL